MNSDTPGELGHKSRLAFLLKDSVLYGGAAAVSKAFSLITFPILTHHLSAADYGAFDFFGVLATLLGILIVFGQDSAVARFFYQYEQVAERRQLISQSLAVQIAACLVVMLVLWKSTPYVAPWLVDTPERDRLFYLVLLQAPFIVLVNFSQNLLKWTFQRKPFLIISLGSVFASVAFISAGVVFFNIGLVGLLCISLGVNAITAVLGLFFVRGWLCVPQSFRYVRELVPYALPVGLICTVGAFVPTLERWLTNQFLGAEELGFYAAGTKIVMLIGMVVSAFQTAWGPFSLSIYKKDDAAKTYNLVLKGFSLGLSMCVLGLSIIAYPVLVLLASPRYAAGAVIVFPLSMALAVQAVSWITEIGIGISKRSHLYVYAYAVYVAVTAVGIWVLAPAFGLAGVAYGVLAGQVAKALIASWLAQKAYSLPWEYKGIAQLGVLLMVLSAAFFLVWEIYGPLQASAVSLAGLAMTLLFGWKLMLSLPERESIVRIARAKIPAFGPRGSE